MTHWTSGRATHLPQLARAGALTLSLLAALASTGGNPAACGPFLSQALFTYRSHPDLPLEPFARGRLGVLQPTYARSYLTLAYRQMQGLTLTPVEAASVAALWRGRINSHGPVDLPLAVADPNTSTSASAGRASGLTQWRDAKKALGGLPAVDVEYRVDRPLPGADYQWYTNIHDDAFRQAASTLRSRIAQFGAKSALVRDWVRAQELVFSAGNDATAAKGDETGNDRHPRPSGLTPLPADAPALARADRAYQLAAADFYRGAFTTAREQFQSIARDTASPWRVSAPYLAARCLLRQATIGPATPADAERLLQQALTELDAVAADPGAPAALRDSSRGLRPWAEQWLAAAITDQARPTAIDGDTAILLATAPGPAIAPALDRFTRMLDRREASSRVAAPFTPALTPAAADLTEWLAIVQQANDTILEARYQPDATEAMRASAGAAAAALARWHERKTLPWLVAALTHAQATTTDIDAALTAAADAMRDEQGPAYATLTYHRARLLIDRRDLAGARDLLDRSLASGGAGDRLPRSALNDLRKLRLRTARSLEEFLADAANPSVATTLIGDDLERGGSDDQMTGDAVADRASSRGDGPTAAAVAGRVADGRVTNAQSRAAGTSQTQAAAVEAAAANADAGHAVPVPDTATAATADSPYPGAPVWFPERRTGQLLFDVDAAGASNQLPLDSLLAAAESSILPAYLRRDLAVAAWTRAVILDDSDVAARATPLLRSLAPVLAADLDAYRAAATPEARRIAGVWTILRHPGLSPIVRWGLGRDDALDERDGLHDNWWCGPRLSYADYTPSMFSTAPAWTGDAPPAFLSSEQRDAAGRQLERLKPASATWLADATVAWAKARPADPRLPQALHLAVQASRFGCTDPATARAARAAFALLHTRFPASPWAAKTRYWYK